MLKLKASNATLCFMNSGAAYHSYECHESFSQSLVAIGEGFCFLVLVFAFPSPVRRLDQSQAGGGVGEHCSSSAV
jgi:hypothetical protein